MMNKIILTVLVMLIVVPTVRAVSVELLENTDQCIFRNGIDHCFSKYLICSENSTIDVKNIKFIFKDMVKEYTTKNELADKLDYEFETEKNEDCYEVSITGWKNPYISIDNILCYNDICFYKYAWWNTSFGFRYECNSDASTSIIYSCNGTSGIDNDIYWIRNETNPTYVYCVNPNCVGGLKSFANDSTEVNWENESTRTGRNPEDLWGGVNAVAKFHMINEANVIYDSSGNSNDGSNSGCVDGTGIFGTGLLFGAGDIVTIGDDATLQLDDAYTVSVWINASVDGYLVDKRSDNPARNANYHVSISLGSIGFYLGDDTNYCECITTAEGKDNTWHHIVITYSNADNEQKIYFDGDLNKTCICNYQASAGDGFPVYLNSRLGGVSVFVGIIDQVEIYNVTLNATQISDMYNSRGFGTGIEETAPPPPPPPPIPIHSFILFRLVSPEIPFIGEFLETLIFKSIIIFMDRLTVLGNVIIGGNLQVAGNVTAENVFIPAYVFAHTNTTIAVASAGTWYNVPFDEEVSDPKSRITHTHNDNTNDTFTIQDSGTYNIHYAMSFSDASPSPTSHIVMRVVKNGVEIKGSLLEEDSTKQYSDFTISNGPIVDLITGDKIKFQFASDDTDVSLTSHRTYGDHHDLGVVKIIRIE